MFRKIFNSKNRILLMKTKQDWVNLEYRISTRKGKATNWISKSSKKIIKEVNIRYSTYDGLLTVLLNLILQTSKCNER